MAIRWERGGYEVESWRLYRVDRRTWADGNMVERVKDVTVSRDIDGSERTIERGELTVDQSVADEFAEGYYRLVMVARQGGVIERVDVATLLCVGTSKVTNRGVAGVRLVGRSVLYPASRDTLPVGSYAPKGVNGAEWAADALRSSINAPVVVSGGFTLDDHVVFESGTKVLAGVWQVLDAGNHIIQIDGRGVVHIVAQPTHVKLNLDIAHARLLMPEVTHELDWSEVPNSYTATDGSATATAVNDLIGSPTSIAERGWVSDMYDSSPVRVNGETLYAYCERRLEEESKVDDAKSYTREWWPDVLPGDIVRGSVSSIGMVGDFRVRSQQLACGNGIVVQERSAREVYAWTRG